MDPLSIGIMLLGAAMSAKAQNDAAQKQQRLAVESRQRAMQAQNEATDVAMKQVQEFDPTVRKAKQDEIQNQLTTQYQQAAQAKPITAQGVQVGQTIPGGSADYLTTKAREVAKATESNRNLAALLGRVGSAGQLRRNEAVRFGDTAGTVGRIGTGAENMANIDRIGIDSVQPSVGGMLAGTVLGAIGQSGASLSGLLGSQPSPYQLSAAPLGTNPDAAMGLGLKRLGGGVGLKSTGNWLVPQG